MPMILTQVNVELTNEKEAALREKLGRAISLLPGKSENWLMLRFEDHCRLSFRGSSEEPTAFVEVKVFGSANAAAYEKLTGEITRILHEELAVAPDHMYISYTECSHWGWNGSNF